MYIKIILVNCGVTTGDSVLVIKMYERKWCFQCASRHFYSHTIDSARVNDADGCDCHWASGDTGLPLLNKTFMRVNVTLAGWLLALTSAAA